MNKIGAYGAYQNTLYNVNNKSKKEEEKLKAEKEEKKEKLEKKESVELSDAAKDLLKELQKKYGNMDFIIANYSSDEEAASYLSRGTKEYSVLIDPETLEKMATDEETKQKYINMIDSATSQLGQVKEQLGEEGENIERLGVTLNEDGTLTFFAELEKMSEKNREYQEKAQEKRGEEKIEKEKKKKAKVQAESVEELIKKIQELNWDEIPEENIKPSGGKFDFSV